MGLTANYTSKLRAFIADQGLAKVKHTAEFGSTVAILTVSGDSGSIRHLQPAAEGVPGQLCGSAPACIGTPKPEALGEFITASQYQEEGTVAPEVTVGPGSGGTTPQSIAFDFYAPYYGSDVPVRVGDSEVGWYKIIEKHQITNPQVVIQTIADGELIAQQDPTKNHPYPRDEFKGELYVNGYPTPIYTYAWVAMSGGQFVGEFVSPIGVLTTYCGGTTVCPSIVNTVS